MHERGEGTALQESDKVDDGLEVGLVDQLPSSSNEYAP